MPKLVSVDGVVHSFPDDATDQEIQVALALPSSQPKPPTPSTDYTSMLNVPTKPEPPANYMGMLKSRKLNSKDMKLAKDVYMTPQELSADASYDRSPENLKELGAAIAAQKDPRWKKLLLDEQARLTTSSFSTILGAK